MAQNVAWMRSVSAVNTRNPEKVIAMVVRVPTRRDARRRGVEGECASFSAEAEVAALAAYVAEIKGNKLVSIVIVFTIRHTFSDLIVI